MVICPVLELIMFWRKLLGGALVAGTLNSAQGNPLLDNALLKPIHIRDWERAHGIGLEKRTSENFADLDPRTQSQLIYGRPGGKF